jgi:hypothetical protein
VAAIVCELGVAEDHEVVQVAFPVAGSTGTGVRQPAIGFVLSVKVTDPLSPTAPVGLAVTVAVKVTDWFTVAEGTDGKRTRDVVPCVTVWFRVDEVLPV